MRDIRPSAQWPEPMGSGAAADITTLGISYDAVEGEYVIGVPADDAAFVWTDGSWVLTLDPPPGAIRKHIRQVGTTKLIYGKAGT